MIRVYGYSDDLIEVEGDVREEFDAYDEGQMFLATSNGALIRIAYGQEGVWEMRAIAGDVTIDPAPGEQEGVCGNAPDYSDVARVEGDIAWVALGHKIAKAK